MWLAVLLMGATGHVGSTSAADVTSLTLTQRIALPGVRGRIDHLAIDLDGGRLFVAALGNDTIEVVDLRRDRRSGQVVGLQEPQGIAYLAAEKRLVAANGRGSRLDIYHGDSLAIAGRIDGLEDADNLRYAPDTHRLYVGYGNALAIIDAITMKRLQEIKLAGHPESFQLEHGGSRIFVNVPSAGQIAVVDPGRGAVVATWPLGGMRANFPMALDEHGHRLFVATRQPARLLVYDTESGARVAEVAIGGDADDLFFDEEKRRIYVICGEGRVDLVDQRDPNHYVASGNVPSAPRARTGLFVPARKALYVAIPASAASSAEIRVYVTP